MSLQTPTAEARAPLVAAPGPALQPRKPNQQVPFFSRDDRPRIEIIEGLIREGQLVAFAGDYGIGKSPFLTDLVLHRVHGIPWCGRSVQEGPVIQFDLENPGSWYRRSMKQTAERYQVSPPMVPGELDIYLEHDDPSNKETKPLLRALESSEATASMTLLKGALARHPNALVLIDPMELFFKIEKKKDTHILALYGRLRRLLARYPQSAIVLTFNLRKPDKNHPRPSLLTDPRGWLVEISGANEILSRSDVRLGIDAYKDEIKVINGIRRGEEMAPVLIRPYLLDGDLAKPAGFELVPPAEVDLSVALPRKLYGHWTRLPEKFTFEQAVEVMGKANFQRLKQRAQSLGVLVTVERGRYRKEITAGGAKRPPHSDD